MSGGRCWWVCLSRGLVIEVRGYRTFGVGLESVRSVYRRWRIRDTVGLVRKPEASWVLFLPVLGINPISCLI